MAPDLATAPSGRDLIPGDPDEVESLGSRLSVLGTGMSDAASRLTTLDAGDWQGIAAEAFQRTLGDEPQKYARAGEAFTSATGAVRRYADVLRTAQADADRAINEYREAESRTAAWRQDWEVHEAQVRRLEASSDPADAGSAATLPRPSSVNPGEAGRNEARELAANAQSSVEQEGQAAAAVLGQAAEGAPDEPGFWGSLWGGVGDFFGGLWENTLGGIIDTVGAFLDDPLGFLGDVWDNLYHHVAIWNWDTFWSTWWGDIKDLIAWDDWAAGRAAGHRRRRSCRRGVGGHRRRRAGRHAGVGPARRRGR
ncbi:MAG: putative T7SS-secreted protein [Acidimicrobiales bacterium]